MFKKYFWPCLKYSLIYLFLPLVFSICSRYFLSFYKSLAESFPAFFKFYSQVLEKELYEEMVLKIEVICCLLIVAVMSYIPSIFENRRYEEIISRTDGCYKIKDELLPYIKENLAGDIIASSLIQALFIPIATITLPEKLSRIISPYLTPHTVLISALGAVGAYFTILSVSLLARLIAAPHALLRYRALWLTSFVDC